MSQPTGTGQQSDPTDPGQQSGQGAPQGDPTGTGTDPGPQGGQQSGTQDPNDAGNQDTTLDALRNKLSLSDKRAQEAERKLQELERAKLDETERVKLELKEAKEALEAAQQERKKLLLRQAFLEDKTYAWRNPASALKLLDFDGVTIGDDEKVQGMKAALDKLAKSDPYLLEENNGSGKTPTGSTGVPPAGGQPAGGVDGKQLAARFPAMRTRGIGN